MNVQIIVGLLCMDDAFRAVFFEKGLDAALMQVPLPLSWTERRGLMALAGCPDVAVAFNQMATAMRRVGCPNSPCPYLYYTIPNQPTSPLPPPDPAATQKG